MMVVEEGRVRGAESEVDLEVRHVLAGCEMAGPHSC
jgi:hypothetical protein